MGVLALSTWAHHAPCSEYPCASPRLRCPLAGRPSSDGSSRPLHSVTPPVCGPDYTAVACPPAPEFPGHLTSHETHVPSRGAARNQAALTLCSDSLDLYT